MKITELFEGQDAYPQQVMLKDGFYIVRKEGEGYDRYIFMYEVHRLMNDDTVFAFGGATADHQSPMGNSWVFRRNVKEGLLDMEPVAAKDVRTFLKFKWWLWNKLISSGVVKDAQ